LASSRRIEFSRSVTGDNGDLLTIKITHEQEQDGPQQLKVYGNFEMGELIGHFRWLANALEQDGKEWPGEEETLTRHTVRRQY
jgi:hypothetical protein